MTVSIKWRLLALLTAAVLAIALIPAGLAAAKGVPTVKTQPTDQTVKEGGKCTFTIKQSGATGITWRFYNPSTGESVLASQAGSKFKGLKVSGQNSEKLRLSNIPGALDGWQVFCTLANKNGKIDTEYATLTVTDKQGNRLHPENSAPAGKPGTDGPAAAASVTAVGASCVHSSENGIDVYRIKADRGEPAYWVFNGVRIDFDQTPQTIEIDGPQGAAVWEAVYPGAASQTLGAVPENASPERIVQAVNADLCHIKGDGAEPGGYFRFFAFAEDYTNMATGQTEQGGQISVCVMARTPAGGRITGWMIDGVQYRFDTDVNTLFVQKLTASKSFEPLFDIPAEPETNGIFRFYAIQCQGCVFSGGGYRQAASGYVPAGTRIVLTPVAGNGTWTVNGGSQGSGAALAWTVNGAVNAQNQ